VVLLNKARVIYDARKDRPRQIEIANLLAMNFFNQNKHDSVVFNAGRSLQLNTITKEEGLYTLTSSHRMPSSHAT